MAAGAGYRIQNRCRQGVRARFQIAGGATQYPCLCRTRMTALAQFGPRLTPSGVTFRLWAPAARKVELMLDRAYPMQHCGEGWHELAIASAGASTATLYKFRIDGE